jgi:hypothetical protein
MGTSRPSVCREEDPHVSWQLDARVSMRFDLRNDESDEKLAALYSKAKRHQWDSDVRLDWSEDFDPENPLGYDDRFLPVFGSEAWAGADESRKRLIRHHYHAYTISQFMHGEQAAMLAAARLVEVAPDMATKKFAATQAADEARHVEIMQRLVHQKLGLAYDMDDGLKALIEAGLSDSRWDFVVLTTQVLIEGLALGALQQFREFSKNRLVADAASYIMADEARHVAFGSQVLVALYRQLSESELCERRDFVREGLDALNRRLNPAPVWHAAEMDTKETLAYVELQTLPRVRRYLGRQLLRLLSELRLASVEETRGDGLTLV